MIEEALNLAYHGARAQDVKLNNTQERDFVDAMAPIQLALQGINRVCLNLFASSDRSRANLRSPSRSVVGGYPISVQAETH